MSIKQIHKEINNHKEAVLKLEKDNERFEKFTEEEKIAVLLHDYFCESPSHNNCGFSNHLFPRWEHVIAKKYLTRSREIIAETGLTNAELTWIFQKAQGHKIEPLAQKHSRETVKHGNPFDKKPRKVENEN